MAERKVFNKYIPPDFDHRLLPKGERPPLNQIKVRSMLPMTICCTQCGDYMGRGTKFNARQEEAIGMEWKGLKRWRFYLKCSSCSQEMTFLTDPENDHYVVEHGCTRNFEPWRVKAEVEKIQQIEQEQMQDNAMELLQQRAAEQKSQLDINDSIANLRHLNSKTHYLDPALIIKRNRKRNFKQMNLENQTQDKLKLEEFREQLLNNKNQNKHFKTDPKLITTYIKTQPQPQSHNSNSNSSLINDDSMIKIEDNKIEIQEQKNTQKDNKNEIQDRNRTTIIVNELPFNSEPDLTLSKHKFSFDSILNSTNNNKSDINNNRHTMLSGVTIIKKRKKSKTSKKQSKDKGKDEKKKNKKRKKRRHKLSEEGDIETKLTNVPTPTEPNITTNVDEKL